MKNKAIIKDGKIHSVELSIKDLKKAMKSLYKGYKVNNLDMITITNDNLIGYLQEELKIEIKRS